MSQTATSFFDKWHQNQDLAFSETSRVGSDIYNWILSRNGFSDAAALTAYLSNKKRILDAGCGNGRVTNLLAAHAPKNSEIVGIDLVAAPVARENLKQHENVTVHEKNLLDPLSDLGQFDFIYCQEVLHHTSDPKQSFLNLCSLLSPTGDIAIYVYKQKAPVREFVDDYIRDNISHLSYEDAQLACKQITELGKRLDALNIEFDAPAVDVLGIEQGRYSVQRFLYHFFMKCFWNPDLSEDANIAINYDWYHPELCTRHTPEEIRGWFKEAGLTIVQECVDHYGITMRGSSLSR